MMAAAQPAGLVPGDTYHLAYVTSNVSALSSSRSIPPPNFDNWGGIPAADWVTTFHAASGAGTLASQFGLSSLHFTTGNPNGPAWNFIDTHWQAILSDSQDGDAITRLNIGGPIYNTQGELVATDKADMFDGAISAPILYDEFGNEVTGNLDAWSGTGSSGFWTGLSCNDWDDPSSSNEADIGVVGSASSSWILSGFKSCNESARLYAVSPAFTVLQPGDVDGDFDVDGDDFLLWQQGFGTSSARLVDGDLDGDGDVDDDDLTVWEDNYGAAALVAASATVPEPGALVLALLAVALSLAGTAAVPCFRKRPRHRNGGG